MFNRKFSEFSLSAANNTYSEDKDVVDLLTNPNNTKKKVPKEEMIKAYVRIRQIDNNPGNPTDPGILPLTLKGIYEQIETEIISRNLGSTPEIFSNYIEIYNEEVFDLLANDGKGHKGKKKVNVKEKDKIFYVKDVTNKPIRNIEDFNDALNLGLVKKTHAATSLNLHSSRSHTIFKLIIRWPVKIDDYVENEAEYEESTLSIVDLAGSERAYRAETSGKELQQACKINHSLYVLGKCMEIMKHNSVYVNKKIVPFRESKLTMLFQEYFQGDQNIIMITNINPCRDDFDETLRVLSYACIAKEIRPVKSRIITNNAIRKKEKSSIYDSCTSEDEEAKTQNRFISKYDNNNQNSSMLFGRESRNPAYQDNPLANNNINYPPTYNSIFTDQLESLKYEFMNMSKKHEEQLAKYEDLNLTNQFLMSKYKELKYQFKLRELDIRTNLIETISNQIINKKVESFLYELEGPKVKHDIKPNLIIANPFYDQQAKNYESGALSRSKENHNKDNSRLDDLKMHLKKTEVLDSAKSKYSDCKDEYQEQKNTNAKLKISDINSKLCNQKRDHSVKEDKIVSYFQAETSDKNSLKPNTKKKQQTEALIKEEDFSEIENKNLNKKAKAGKNSEVYISKNSLEKNLIFSKEKEEEPEQTSDILASKNNILKKSFKQAEKTYKKEETLKDLSELDGNRDQETQSNESNSSQIKTKNKKNNKKPTKAKKYNKKSNKLNSDTESELDYSRDSTHTLPKTKKNQKSTDYEEDIEEENSEDFDKVNKSFKENKKTKKKTKKPKKAKKSKFI